MYVRFQQAVQEFVLAVKAVQWLWRALVSASKPYTYGEHTQPGTTTIESHNTNPGEISGGKVVA